ncbi:5-oxoprolinase subunit PxpA [Vibrio sp. SCSIO 43140]|uniref:5-oxoprolinase subunit PxpA n=1 Tax=Vibrio sp. SCSIO 43140 TaxID=2819100 RepID=UPI002075BD72|nr:5-oxoprolinase subunit PxpA [Vibrio sp. SCSIO 43140]USD61675.1 5-oxoprolinase subunit PxpA [Vibrio sp. SCSIO 43140]
MKLNCDMGESFGLWKLGEDEAVMPYLDMANIACGMHASDPMVMKKTIELANQYGVTIGAHPGYPDLQGFGRRTMQMTTAELESFFVYQLGALEGLCRSEATRIQYVKPHGALYNTMMKDDAVMCSLLKALSRFNPQLPLVVMAVPERDHYLELASDYGVELFFEAFVDRVYADDGRLTPRTLQGSSHTSIETIKSQAIQLIENQSVTSISGKTLPVVADTLCIHGDGALARQIATVIRSQLECV